MQQDIRIARRYAQALFSTALKHDVVRAVEEDLNGIVLLLESDRGFRDFIVAPYASQEEKIQIMDRVFSDRVTALTMRVLRVLLEKRRESEITHVRDQYVRLRREEAGILFVSVTTSEALDEVQRKDLVAKLTTTLGKTIDPEYRVDSALIGGIRVAYDNNVLDGSIKGLLGRLRERLRYDLLKQA